MPFKDPEQKKEYNKNYRKENGKEVDRKRTAVLQKQLESLSPEEQQKFIQKRREIVLKSYYKNRDKILEKNRTEGFKRALKNLYNLSYDEYLIILDKQDKKCAICGCKEFEKRWTSTKLPFAVDHCHTTGKIRGLLCDNCNVMIGHAHENIEILEKSIKYLKDNE